MHAEALAWLAENRPAGPQVVLDLGSREAGAGRVRSLFNDSLYVGLDAQSGAGVDYVADITDRDTWPAMDPFTVVVCAEVLEHEREWGMIFATAHDALEEGGTFLVTAAAPGRPPHTCRPLAYTPTGSPDQDGGYPPNPGEYYSNIEPYLLEEILRTFEFFFVKMGQDLTHHDVYAKAVK